MSRGCVLCVDDKANILKLLARILGERHDLTTAADSASALTLIGSRRFDVILTDIRMPGADGFACSGRRDAARRKRRWC